MTTPFTPPFTPDDEMLMAYADGELDPLNAKRVEKAMEADPALARVIEDHRTLRSALGGAFAPILDQPVPDHLTAMLQSNVVALAPRPAPAPQPRRWLSGLAIAASLVAGIAVGTQWTGTAGPVAAGKDGLIASGPLARALNTQLASAQGDTRMLASFRESNGGYCRVFAGQSFDGIACKGASGWQLRQTQSAGARQGTDYAQAGSGSAKIMAAAQEMMAGEPLDEAAEKQAVTRGWK